MRLTIRQRKAATKLHSLDGGAVWWRVGCGKTRIAYAIFAMIAKSVGIADPKFIVVCRRQAFEDWKLEADKLGLEWTVVDQEMDLSTLKRPKVWLVSHAMLHRLLDDILPFSSMIQAVCYDEGFLFKNPKTKHCKAANVLSEEVGRAFILSGSVMTARNLEDVFGQLYAINKHQILARTLSEFRSRFMFKFQIGQTANRFKFTNQKGATKNVAALVRPISTVHFPENNSRKVVNDIRKIEPSKQQVALIQQLKEEYYIKVDGKELELKNAPSLIVKCQQISDGWVKMGDGTVVSVPSGKLDYLLGQVQELIACGERVLVWCAFKESVRLVLQALQKLKIKAYAMTGGIPFDSQGWNRDGQVAVATEASGSSVNHFRNCAYAIYYSMDVRWLNLQQSRGRTNRHDSSHSTCYYYFLQTRGSLDSFIYRKATQSGEAENDLTKLIKWVTTT